MIILRRKLTDSRVYLVVVEVLWAEGRWLNIVALTLNCEYRAVGTEHQPGPGLVAGLRGHRVSRGQPRHGGRGRGLLPLLGGVLLGPAAAREEHHGHCHEVTRLSRRSGSRAGVRATRGTSPRPGRVFRGRESDVNWPLALCWHSPRPPGGPGHSLLHSEDSDLDQVKSIAAGSPRPPARLRHRGRRARTVTHLSVFSARCLHLLLLWGNNTGARHQHSHTALVSIEMLRGSSVT